MVIHNTKNGCNAYMHYCQLFYRNIADLNFTVSAPLYKKSFSISSG